MDFHLKHGAVASEFMALGCTAGRWKVLESCGNHFKTTHFDGSILTDLVGKELQF